MIRYAAEALWAVVVAGCLACLLAAVLSAWSEVIQSRRNGVYELHIAFGIALCAAVGSLLVKRALWARALAGVVSAVAFVLALTRLDAGAFSVEWAVAFMPVGGRVIVWAVVVAIGVGASVATHFILKDSGDGGGPTPRRMRIVGGAGVVLLGGAVWAHVLARPPQTLSSALGSARRGADVGTALFQVVRDPAGTPIGTGAVEAVGYVHPIDADPQYSVLLAIRSPQVETQQGIVFPEAQLQLVATNTTRRWGPGIDSLSDLFVVNLNYAESRWVLEHGVPEGVSDDLLQQAYAAGSVPLTGGGRPWAPGSEKTSADFPPGTFGHPAAGGP